MFQIMVYDFMRHGQVTPVTMNVFLDMVVHSMGILKK